MSLTVYTFLPRWNFIPGWTHPCQKDRDKISSWDEKKTCKHFIPGWNLKWACFFFYFWLMYYWNMLSKVSVFEHNESMNIMKHKASLYKKFRKEKGWGQQLKYKNFKNIFIISIIFFMKFRKDWTFLLL